MRANGKSEYWFPAKRYGWGWGFPSTWQGWVTLVTWLVVVLVGAPWIAMTSRTLASIFGIAMSVVLLAICWAKGEPPRWRWG